MVVYPASTRLNAHDADVFAIQTLTQSWLDATHNRDIPRLLSLVTDDVVFLPPTGDPIAGKSGVETLYKSFFAQFKGVQQFADTQEIQVNGDLAYLWGPEELRLVPAAGGPEIHLLGRGISILRRENGEWKFARAINNLAPEPKKR